MAKKILVIDDDPLVLKSIRKLLEKEGYFIDTAKCAKEALEKVEVQEFQLIICDIRMPEIDGIDLIGDIRRIRKDENKPDIPVIFITGYASEEAPAKADKLGAMDYILKPFDIDKLLNSVKKSLADRDGL